MWSEYDVYRDEDSIKLRLRDLENNQADGMSIVQSPSDPNRLMLHMVREGKLFTNNGDEVPNIVIEGRSYRQTFDTECTFKEIFKVIDKCIDLNTGTFLILDD